MEAASAARIGTDPQSRDLFGHFIDWPRTALPSGETSIGQLVRQAALTWPTVEALVGRHARYTFATLDRAVDGIAALLVSKGVSAGVRVAASAGNHPDLVIAFFATMRLGAIWVGVSRALAAPEKAYMLNDCDASVYLVDRATHDAVNGLIDCPLLLIDAEAPADEWREALRSGNAPHEIEVDSWAAAAIAYTSGTTGRPKGAVHSQRNIFVLPAAMRALAIGGQWQAGLSRGVALPLTILNLMTLGPVTAAMYGATCVCIDRVDAVGIAEWVDAEQVGTIALAPTQIHDLLTKPDMAGFHLASLRAPTAGGGVVSRDLRKRYRARFGAELGTGYGLTEAMAGVAEAHGDFPENSCGQAYPHIEIGIFGANLSPLPPGSDGEVRIRAATEGAWRGVYTPMLGYWRRPAETAECLQDGWLSTGDIGCLDEEGNLTLKDRRNNVIIRGGANVYPAEIERVVGLDEAVASIAVVGVRDDRLGERVAAVLQLHDLDEPEAVVARLLALCSAELARYKIPDSWFLIEAMPRNAMGKIIRSDLLSRLPGLTSIDVTI